MADDPNTPTPANSIEQPPSIDGYGSGVFRVDRVIHTGSLIVMPTGVVAWPVANFGDVDETNLAPSMFGDAHIELLLLGCGERMEMVPRELRDALRAVGTVVEPMGTGAAVRTYNVLLGENRRVAAALIAVD